LLNRIRSFLAGSDCRSTIGSLRCIMFGGVTLRLQALFQICLSLLRYAIPHIRAVLTG